ncbi:MAG: hypothetical protein AAGJ31_10410, partial [Verrucomicrobiota bacterium]
MVEVLALPEGGGVCKPGRRAVGWAMAWKTKWNLMMSIILFALSGWAALADFLYPGDILFQTSWAWLLLGMVSGGWFLAAHVLAIFPKRFLFPISLLVGLRFAYGFPFHLWLENTISCRILSVLLLGCTGLYLGTSLLQMVSLEKREAIRLRHTLTVLAAGVIWGVLSLPVSVVGMSA